MAALILNELDYLDSVLYYPVLVVVLGCSGTIFFLGEPDWYSCGCVPKVFVSFWKNRKELNPYRLFRLLWYLRRRVSVRGILLVFLRLFVSAVREAFFWMWLVAIIGGASAFIESTLAQIYKRRDSQGGSYGGPAYYIETALHSRFIGAVLPSF